MNVQKPETKKFFILQVQRRETATNHTPVYTFGLGYPPPRQKQIYSQTLKTQRL